MASQIILDMEDPGVAALAAGWTDGESYPIPQGTMTQVSKDEKRVILDINEIMAEEAPQEPAPEEEAAPEAPATKSKSAVQVKY